MALRGHTYESVLDDMLSRVPNDIDKREGSIMFDALAPVAQELLNLYTELEVFYNEVFADTASLYHLQKRCRERGIEWRPATAAEVKATMTGVSSDLSGESFSCEGLIYTVTEQLADGYRLTCQTAGEAGNLPSGRLVPVDYIDGLQSAQIIGILEFGREEEETEHLRERYFATLRSQAFGGNVLDYRERVGALDGVGGCKVVPLWNGAGTVKIVLLNAQHQAPSQELVQSIQQQIDPAENAGEGAGIAPIGHTVTVVGVQSVPLTLTAQITYAYGYTDETAAASIQVAVESYLLELRKDWDSLDYLIVRISQIETRLLALSEVIDVQNTTINGTGGNLTLGAHDVPVWGAFDGQG